MWDLGFFSFFFRVFVVFLNSFFFRVFRVFVGCFLGFFWLMLSEDPGLQGSGFAACGICFNLWEPDHEDLMLQGSSGH